MAHLTVRAWRSTGAPESTAAATESPGSLPSITRFGMGEKFLNSHVLALSLAVFSSPLTMSGSR